jgi:NAD(P)-dependent dehydrogenase (short-subunit alcohol dehydrogenase family)
MMSGFSNKLAFMTGGSSGIGLATANLLAAQGCNLVLFARGQKMLDEACKTVKTKMKSSSQKVNAVSMDVADNDDVQQKIKLAVEKFGVPDILINSAGVGSGDYFENISYEQFDRLLKINVYGTRNTVSAILPFMKQKGGGHIVNIASVAGLIGMYGYSLYCTSKYAIVGFSECLRSELKRFNINVTLICPPEVKTPFYRRRSKDTPARGADRKESCRSADTGTGGKGNCPRHPRKEVSLRTRLDGQVSSVLAPYQQRMAYANTF